MSRPSVQEVTEYIKSLNRGFDVVVLEVSSGWHVRWNGGDTHVKCPDWGNWRIKVALALAGGSMGCCR